MENFKHDSTIRDSRHKESKEEMYSRYYPPLLKLATIPVFVIVLWAVVNETIKAGFDYLLALKLVAVLFFGLWIGLAFWLISFPRVGFKDNKLVVKKIRGTTLYPLRELRLAHWDNIVFRGLKVRHMPQSAVVLRVTTWNITSPLVPDNAGGYSNEFVEKLKESLQETK